MDSGSIVTELAQLVNEVSGVPSEDVTINARIVDDLDIDSLMVLELGVVINERWDIELTDEDLEGVATIGDVARLIESRLTP